MHFLVKISKQSVALEIGTYLGYSALVHCQRTPKRWELVTCEINPENAQKGPKHFELSPHGLQDKALGLGDALQTIPSTSEEFDGIFLDAHQAQYPKYYELVPRQVAAGRLGGGR